MLLSVATESLRDQRRSLSAWAAALAALVGLYVAIYPSIRGNTAYSDVLNQMPESLRAFFTAGPGGDLTTPEGYLYAEFFSLMGPLLVLVFAIGVGAASVAGEEDRHTLDLLLVNPISRTRVVLEKFAALTLSVVLLMGVAWAVILCLGTMVDMQLGPGDVAAAIVHLGMLGVEFGALALLLGCALGRPGVARAVPALIAVAAYLVNGLAPLIGWLMPFRKLSPFYQYIGNDPMNNGVAASSLVTMIATSAVLVVAAILLFNRRDIAA